MARHSDGQNNFRIAGWVWVVFVVLIAVTALVIGWGFLSGKNSDNLAKEQCAEGDYELTVWSDPKSAPDARKLVDQYNASERVVADHCVRAVTNTVTDDEAIKRIKDGTSAPAAWIPTDAKRAIDEAARAGVHVTGAESPRIGPDNKPLLRMAVGNHVDETSSRSAADLSDFAIEEAGHSTTTVAEIRDTAPPENETPVAKEQEQEKKREEKQSEKPQDEDNAMIQAGTNMTFLLDTSGSMGLVEGAGTRLDGVRAALHDAFAAVTQSDGKVGLWNYSSQLSPTARTPYRNNVDISLSDDGSLSGAILDQLTFGGATYTNSSVVATYDSVVAFAKDTPDQPHRLLLITDGNNDDDTSLEDTVAQIQMFHQVAPVRLDVITIGDNIDVEPLRQIAEAAGGTVSTTVDSQTFAGTLREVVGF